MRSLRTFPQSLKRLSDSGLDSVPGGTLLAGGVFVAVALLLVATFVARAEESERIRLANTGGTLTALVELNGDRILFGAGRSRSHSADFVGRSTRPWDRDIDLLVIPGWDDEHATGALGLLGRHEVHGIAVIGIPGEAPIWSILERAAGEAATPIRYLESAHELRINDRTTLRITPAAEDHNGAWVRVEHDGFRIDYIDAEFVERLAPPPVAFERRNEHVLINARSHGVPEGTEPGLLIQPRPFWDDEFGETDAHYLIELERNQHTELRFDSGEIRAPLVDLTT